MLNNPLRYIDPTGHDGVCAGSNADPECFAPDPWTPTITLGSYGVSVSGGTSEDQEEILDGVSSVANAMLDAYYNSPECYWNGCTSLSATQMFISMFGTVNISIESNSSTSCSGSMGAVTCGGSASITGRFIAHELGHTFAWTMQARGYINPYKTMQNMMIYDSAGNWVSGKSIGALGWNRGLSGYDSGPNGDYSIPSLYHGPVGWNDWNRLEENGRYTGTAYNEEWADMFMNWSYGSFEHSYAGFARHSWMTTQISSFLP